jgi:hypothetical protein
MPDNGVIERLFRTLKEQVVHGRIFQTIDEVRDAVRAFVVRYNAEWLIENVNGGRIPGQCGGVKAGQCRQELLLWKGPRSGPFP